MRIQILILGFKGLKKLLKTLKDYINNTAIQKEAQIDKHEED